MSWSKYSICTTGWSIALYDPHLFIRFPAVGSPIKGHLVPPWVVRSVARLVKQKTEELYCKTLQYAYIQFVGRCLTPVFALLSFMGAPDLQWLRQNDRSMIRWICCVKPHDIISIDLLCARLGIQEVTAAIALSVLDGMDTSSDAHPVSSLSQIWRFYVQECVGDQERHGQIVWRLTWMLAALVASILKTESPGDQVLEVLQLLGKIAAVEK